VSTFDGMILGVTKIVDYGRDTKRWNLAILGDGYQAGELTSYAADAQELANCLQTTPPLTRCGRPSTFIALT